MAVKRQGTGKKNGKLLMRAMGAALAAMAAVAALITAIGAGIVSRTYGSLIIEELKATCEHLDSAVSSLNDDGDWSMEGDALLKGGEPIAGEIEDIIDRLRQETGIDYTIFYGDTRILTTIYKKGTGQKLTGTKASDAVVAATLRGGQEYHSDSLNIEGSPYFGYYRSLRNSDGSTVGMVFTGRESSDVDHAIWGCIMGMALAALVPVALVAAIGMIYARKVSSQMGAISGHIRKITDGGLGNEVDPALISRTDEIGDIAGHVATLDSEISGIIADVREVSGKLTEQGAELASTASQIADTSDGVSNAVGEMAKGATDQADTVQKATESIGLLSDAIQNVADNAESLASGAAEMNDASQRSADALKSLKESMDRMGLALTAISAAMEETNAAVDRVNGKVDGITGIAAQTNLLALNASIEAARAGEMGRGFAVVAEEIGKLAADSANTASEIKDEMGRLLEQSEGATSKAAEVSGIGETVTGVLDDTVGIINSLIGNVAATVDGVNNISALTEECNASKEQIVDAMSSLSAISEENAASTEETSASMEELNATVSMLASAAGGLNALAGDLEKELSFFRIGEGGQDSRA